MLRRVADRLDDRTDELAELMALEMGKPVVGGRGEVEKCAWVCRYYADHGAYPTCVSVGGGRTTIMLQLTQYTDAAGNTSETRSGVYRFGPYLRSIPPLGVTDRKSRDRINTTDNSSIGWIYTPATGAIRDARSAPWRGWTRTCGASVGRCLTRWWTRTPAR